MPGRIGRAFEAARRDGRGAFVPYLTSGFPDPAASDRLALALCEEGADVLELGVPFSDPVADGPVIQETAQAALRAGATLERTLAQARALRARHETPLVVMTYLNPIVRLGLERFAAGARNAGVDGVILVDLPPEEDPGVWSAIRAAGLDTIALVSPTTEESRMAGILAGASGFLYVVARLGVTGKGAEDAGLRTMLERCRRGSPLPRCLGFGIGPGTDLTRYRGLAEGVVVGSALLEPLLQTPDPGSREETVRRFARAMRERVRALAPS